jgi:hypothetical protein
MPEIWSALCRKWNPFTDHHAELMPGIRLKRELGLYELSQSQYDKGHIPCTRKAGCIYLYHAKKR